MATPPKPRSGLRLGLIGVAAALVTWAAVVGVVCLATQAVERLV